MALVPLSSLLPLVGGLTGGQHHIGPSSMLPAPGDETPALCLQVVTWSPAFVAQPGGACGLFAFPHLWVPSSSPSYCPSACICHSLC